jgi:hypothetical protein
MPTKSQKVLRPTPKLADPALLADVAKQLCLQDEFSLLVLLRGLVRLIVFPPDRLVALLACNVPHDVPSRRHIALARLPRADVHHAVEEIRFSMLSAEVLSPEKDDELVQPHRYGASGPRLGRLGRDLPY